MEKGVDTPDNYDFVFSFAGEDRKLVQEIYEILSGWGYRIFYDNAYQSMLIGQDLYHYLRKLYRTKGRFVVCFISQYYTQKAWTAVEFSAIKERMMATFFASDFLLPIQIGSTNMLEDIPRFIGFYHHESAHQTAEILREKYRQTSSGKPRTDNYALFIDDLLNHTIAYLKDRFNIDALRDGLESLIVDDTIFTFTIDAFSQASGILIWKQSRGLSNMSTSMSFPSAILTWKQSERLVFSFYPFCIMTDDMEENIPWNQTAQQVGDFIWGCIYE